MEIIEELDLVVVTKSYSGYNIVSKKECTVEPGLEATVVSTYKDANIVTIEACRSDLHVLMDIALDCLEVKNPSPYLRD